MAGGEGGRGAPGRLPQPCAGAGLGEAGAAGRAGLQQRSPDHAGRSPAPLRTEIRRAPGRPHTRHPPRDRAHDGQWQASSLRSPPRPEGPLPAPTASGAQGSSRVTRPGPRPFSARPPADNLG